MTHPHPQISRIKLDALRPTQMTVGYAEIKRKRASWKTLKRKARQEFLEQHWFPSILGPQNRYYIVDHHHLGRALQEEGIESVWVLTLKDLSWLETPTFWRVMEYHQWVHPFDCNGERLGFDAIPKKLKHLQDDPYRSLAGALRNQGGFSKDITPFSEFLWADFFRVRIPAECIVNTFDNALEQAMTLAYSAEARYLPGWVGIPDNHQKIL